MRTTATARHRARKPWQALIALALLLTAGCAATGDDAVRELGKAGARSLAAAQLNLDTATQGMTAGLQRHCRQVDPAGPARDGGAAADIVQSVGKLTAVRETRNDALSRLRRAYLAFREIEDKGDPLPFAQAADETDHRLAQWRASVSHLSGPVVDRDAPPLPAPERSFWRSLRTMTLGEPLRRDAREASERLRLHLLASTAILEAERKGVVALQRATSQLRLSSDLALWRADQLDLSPLAAQAAGDKPRFVREAARKQMKAGTDHGREFAARRLAEYLDDEDRALAAVYNAAIKTLERLQAAHLALAAEADLDLAGVKRSVEQMARATQAFDAAP